MESVRVPPSVSDFTPLSEHQSQTPASFHDGPTILYHQSSACTLRISARDLATAPAFEGLASAKKPYINGHLNGQSREEAAVEADDGHEDSPDVEISNVDVWVTSERLMLFSTSSNAGVSISYPSISLHAVQRPSEPSPIPAPALYLQLLPEANATYDDHDPDETMSLYIFPNASSNPAVPIQSSTPEQDSETDTDSSDEVTIIYTALSACANLHPDPLDGDDEIDEDDDANIRRGQHPAIAFAGQTESGMDGVYSLDEGAAGGLPPPMPGSGGWITADNVGDFFDEDGNWRASAAEGQEAGATLGEGAGRTRGREEEDPGEGEDGEETKWTRTG